MLTPRGEDMENDETQTQITGEGNQSINQRSSQSHTRAEEKPHPSTTTGGGNPASRSDAGLGAVSESRQH